MAHSEHKIVFQDSRDLGFIPSESIALIVTSPPYLMIAMWDDLFVSLNDDIGTALDGSEGRKAFELMHLVLDRVWNEAFRVTKVHS
ncbi:MAG: site-specific DNA-methyltransferase [Planctomycetes bacterium]|nr:site-specific DNA-methyltransferase [Planctomycetota bacterium]